MREIVSKILGEYTSARQETFAGHAMGAFFRNDIPDLIYSTGIVDRETYLVAGSVGQGNWATIPWICIFDRRITTSAQRGVYIVYLLSKDGNSLYLTLNQGCTDISRTHSKKETVQIMKRTAKEIRDHVSARGFQQDDGVFLGDGLTRLGDYYQKGAIFYKEYKKEAIPSEEKLQADLSSMVQIYADYVEYSQERKAPQTGELRGDEPVSESTPEDSDVGRIESVEIMSIKEALESIKNYIAAKGFSYEDGLIENFYLSLKSKPFVILAGISGTGKTRLVRLFAEAVGATVANGRYKMVPVRPDWSDSSDLFGHVDLNGRFVPGAIIDFIKRASEDCERPYFLCLDEMNLARVEYYLSDVLSIMETRDFVDGKILSEPLIVDSYYGADESAVERYGTLRLPENLYLIGTVNMDETTFPFSKKVLDRANTIEFSYVDLMPRETAAMAGVAPLDLPNDFLKTEYLLFHQCAEAAETAKVYCSQLQNINQILQRANAHVGYRVRDEIVFYLLNNRTADLISDDEAMDNQIMQKILPRIQGSSVMVRYVLCGLFKCCAEHFDEHGAEYDGIGAKMIRMAREDSCRYKKSAEKIAFMMRRYEEDGFTSYWL